MPKVNIPPPFNMQLNDAHSRGRWYFQLIGQPSVSWLTQDSFSIVLNSEGRKIGDYDEQRDWSGGRGGERFSDDPTKYKDAKEACTWIPGHVFPSLQWQIASGYRDAEFTLLGSKSWRGLYGDKQSISRTVTASASSNRDKAWIWIRRVGTPGTLTVEWRTDTAGSPSSTISKTVDVTTTDVADVISVLQAFDWPTTTAVTSATVYHLVACGASTDDDKNHWEVAVDTSGTSSFISNSNAGDAGTWTAADFSMYYRVTDAEIDRRWWFFIYASSFYKVSNEATTKLYKWNESTDVWEEVTGHGLTTVTGRPIEVNGFCYFPTGDTTAIRVYNGTNWDAQTITAGKGCATGLAIGYNAADGKTQIWRYNNALVSGGTTTGLAKSVSRAPAVGTYTTDLAFKNSIEIGETSTNITGIDSVNNTLWVRKTNEIGTVDNDRYTELNYGIKKTPSTDNGIAFASWNSLVFYNWLSSFERVYSGTVDDVGQGYKNNSLPFGREGVVSAFTTYVAWMFYVIDAGTSGTSSVMLYDGLNHHEFARGWASGRRIRDVFIQPVSGARNRLWFDCGGDSVFVELPLNKGNPLDDTGAKYMHEFVLESSEIDMGTASKLAKFIKEMTITSKNLNRDGIKIDFDYQLDENIGTSTWVQTEDPFVVSPEDTIQINEGNLRKFAYRLRGKTDNQLIPADIRGIVPNGFARSPQRRILECTAKIKDLTVNGKSQKAKDVVAWLEEASEGAFLIYVASTYEQYNDFYAILAPPNIYPVRANPEADNVTFTLLVL
jgi:hypothetical protein